MTRLFPSFADNRTAAILAVVGIGIALLLLPIVDGRGEHPASFEVPKEAWTAPTYLSLTSAEVQDGGGVWLRYKTKSDSAA